MPIENGIGYSEHTGTKHTAMFQCGELHQQVSERILRRNAWMGQEYHLIDVTAGNGRAVGLDGDPSYDVRLLLAAEVRFGDALHARLVERDQANVTSLRSVVGSRTGVDVLAGDHRDMLPEIGKEIGKSACGLLILDPNPGRENIASGIAVGEFCSSHQRIDVMVFLAGTMFKRIKDEQAPTIMDLLATLGKRYWRMGPLFGANQYVVAMGTNW